jgi:hypothetical protein
VIEIERGVVISRITVITEPANIGLRKSCADFGASSARTLAVL